ncbi:hypothetical protein RHSIM_RhsimUnG0224900 [Rhododendron simsii]|uniref:Uncharacterized protein n=1 Tax=Rhododendron simsii TaxID=118357 RepID=A0A834FTI1_RHOSS|nr:hypothetical protein RHSIM_RhsimUnG0224900 [Rhododendron simsii]
MREVVHMITNLPLPVAALPLFRYRKPRINCKTLGTNNGADHDHGVINPDPTLFPARELRPSSSVPSAQEAVAASSQNRSSSPYDVTIPMEGAVQEPVETTATTTRGSTDNCPFKLGKIFAVQAFEAALALMTFRFQPHGSSLALSSSMLTMVAATVLFGITFTVIGLMLRKACPAIATAAAGVLSTVYVYSLAKPSARFMMALMWWILSSSEWLFEIATCVPIPLEILEAA